ncbi:MAG: hypothetical protein IMY69_08355, partial [Bacteroidetes bacterium]|nr:hypothetical protein [Bacteroidota bacterium]
MNSLKSGQLNLSDITAEFKGNNAGIVGNKVFRNFKVTLDWDNNKIYLEPVKQAELNKLMTFGFKPVMK